MRYSRQELVIGKEWQKKLSKSSVAILGVGALGTVASELLARAGVGKLLLIDRDVVEETNLQRQTLFSEKDVGIPKAEAAAKRLRGINSQIKIISRVADVNHRTIGSLLASSDLILDCTDNLSTRFLLNEYAKKNKKFWIHGGAIREEGNVMLVSPSAPCFRCTFGEAKNLETCDTVGVLGTVTAMIGALQAHLAIQFLIGKKISQELVHVTLSPLRVSRIQTKKNPLCAVCRGRYDYLDGKKEPRILTYGCSGMFHFFLDTIDLHAVQRKLQRIGEVRTSKDALFFQNLTIFRSGKVLVKVNHEREAKAAIAKYL
ncbi:HesA/MoeB/ThiF family protein [Candidatus Woesearchaeota archaeon]|nr:HesA/MoeB/ThiF family protein [Candidatus Woesearchaeota archaeon]